MRVYKFIDAKFGLHDLQEKRLKISEYEDLNDPFELRAIRIPHRDLQDALRRQLSTYGVMCFSRAWTNPLLWSHYAEKHRGMCLGFDLTAVETIAPEYVEKPEAFTGDLFAVLAGRDIKTFEVLVRKALYLKYNAWNYEDEVRVMSTLDREGGTHAFKQFDAELVLREVTLGVRSTDQTVEGVITAVASYSWAIPVYQADLSVDSFTMTRTEIRAAGSPTKQPPE